MVYIPPSVSFCSWTNNGAGNIGTTYSTDAFWQAFGESFQSYVEGSLSKEDTIAKIEKDWQEIEGSQE